MNGRPATSQTWFVSGRGLGTRKFWFGRDRRGRCQARRGRPRRPADLGRRPRPPTTFTCARTRPASARRSVHAHTDTLVTAKVTGGGRTRTLTLGPTVDSVAGAFIVSGHTRAGRRDHDASAARRSPGRARRARCHEPASATSEIWFVSGRRHVDSRCGRRQHSSSWTEITLGATDDSVAAALAASGGTDDAVAVRSSS